MMGTHGTLTLVPWKGPQIKATSAESVEDQGISAQGHNYLSMSQHVMTRPNVHPAVKVYASTEIADTMPLPC